MIKSEAYKIDYLIPIHGIEERKDFYNRLHDLGFKDGLSCNKDFMIHNSHPFAVCLEKKTLVIITSVFACFHLQTKGKLKRKEEFLKMIDEKKII